MITISLSAHKSLSSAITASVPGDGTGAAKGLIEALDEHLAPSDQADYEHYVSTVRAGMGDKAHAAAWAEGRAMTLEQAIEYALAADTRPEEGHGSSSNVTPR
jgi:hypothetical protein